MSPPIKISTFAGGEITPAAWARSDLSLYEKSARTLRNMICMRHGGVVGRPGTEYVSTALNGGNQVRLIPFIFNETGLGQSYVLEFGNLYIAFYQNGGNVISSSKTISSVTQANPAVVTASVHGFSNGDIITIEGVLGMTQLNNGYFIVQNTTTNTFTMTDLLGNVINSSSYSAYVSGGTANKIYIISSPYAQADLQSISFAQNADIVTLVHANYPPMELARSSAISWSLTTIAFGPTIATPGVPSLSGTIFGNGSRFYTVVAISQTQEESNVSQGGGPSIADPTLTSPIGITWTAVPNAIAYKIYFTSVGTGASGYLTTTLSNSWSDDGSLTPDYSNNPPLTFTNPFTSSGNYPSTVGFVQQRRAFANTKNNPVGFWISQTGDYYNFNTNITPADSDSIISSLAGEEVNQIQAIFELKFGLMLTSGAEIYLQGNGSGVITPSAINASTQSQYGASTLRPLKVSDVLIFQQALGSFIRDFAFDFAIDGYRGNDISIFAAHLFEGYQIVDWCYQKVPDSIIWVVRSDGVLLSCTYVREQQTLAWTHHDFTNGFVENVVAIPENGEYAVYVSIRRVINGATVRYIERLSSRLWPDTVNTPAVQNDPINASYLDSFIEYDGRNTSQTTMQLLGFSTITIVAGVNDNLVEVIIEPNVLFFNVVIAAGTYTPEALATAIQTAINALPSIGTHLFTVTFTNVFIFSCADSDFEFQFSGTSTNHPISPSLGFQFINYTSSGRTISAPASPPSNFNSSSSAYQQSLLLVSNASYFTSAMVSDQIFLQDELWIQSKGQKGNQLKCTIQAYTDSTHVTITPESEVPVEFQNAAITTWAHAVQTVSGLGYLQGQKVSIWADRYLVGSPLNYNIETVYTIPTDGTITLDECYSVIYVGLPMIQDVETLDLETYFGATLLGKKKRTAGLRGYLYETRNFYAGSENPDTNNQNTTGDPLYQLSSLKLGVTTSQYNQPPPLVTQQDYVITNARWNKRGSVFLRNVDPIPFGLLAISPNSEISENTPYYRA